MFIDFKNLKYKDDTLLSENCYTSFKRSYIIYILTKIIYNQF
jgi:hypothetical protein